MRAEKEVQAANTPALPCSLQTALKATAARVNSPIRSSEYQPLCQSKFDACLWYLVSRRSAENESRSSKKGPGAFILVLLASLHKCLESELFRRR